MTSTTSAGPHGVVATLRRPSRVPRPTPSFWLVKVLTTGMGETASDSLVKTFAPELVVPAAVAVLVVVLLLQLRQCRYRPAVYWSAALMVGIVGTMAADVLHVGLGLPYLASVTGFGIALAVVFIAWRRAEGTLSVHDITTGRRERFYWAAVIATFALGTAAGDLTASTLGLGYLGSAVLFAAAFAAPGVVYALVRRGPVVTFWIAYVLTRPLGASVADWFAVPTSRGGLDLGAGPVSLCLLAVFVVAVALLSRRDRASARRRRHLA